MSVKQSTIKLKPKYYRRFVELLDKLSMAIIHDCRKYIPKDVKYSQDMLPSYFVIINKPIDGNQSFTVLQEETCNGSETYIVHFRLGDWCGSDELGHNKMKKYPTEFRYTIVLEFCYTLCTILYQLGIKKYKSKVRKSTIDKAFDLFAHVCMKFLNDVDIFNLAYTVLINLSSETATIPYAIIDTETELINLPTNPFSEDKQ